MDDFIKKDNNMIGDSSYVMRHIELTLQQKHNVFVPAIILELNIEGEDWDYDDLYDVLRFINKSLESFGEVDMLETNSLIAVVLYKKFLDAFASLEFLRDIKSYKKNPESINVRWYRKEDEGSISKSFKRKIQTFIEKNTLNRNLEGNYMSEQHLQNKNSNINMSFPQNFSNNINKSPIYSNLSYLNNYEMLNNNNNHGNKGFNNNNSNNINNFQSYNNNYSNNYTNISINNFNINDNIYQSPQQNYLMLQQNSPFMHNSNDFNLSMGEVPHSNYMSNVNNQSDFNFFQIQGSTKPKFSFSSISSFNSQDQSSQALRKNSTKTIEGKEKEKSSNEKFTCKFEIQIENDNEFQVCRKLIGSKGCNMKNIVDICKNHSMVNISEPVKLRLRGKGSGYKEGPEQKESEENLHLCVSSKYQDTYYLACKLVEELILQMYDEYKKFSEKKGLNIPRLMIRKIEGDHTSVNYNMTKNSNKKNTK